MQFAIIVIIMLICSSSNGSPEEPTEKEKEEMKRRSILLSKNFNTMEISEASKEKFEQYLTQFCLKAEKMTESDYLNRYIKWEQIEFLDSLQGFLGENDEEKAPYKEYFNHIGHNTESNCSIINEKVQRDTHHSVGQAALFDNYMYDQMTRNEWTGIVL